MNIKQSVTTHTRDIVYDVVVEIMLTTFCNVNCDYCCKNIGSIPADKREHLSFATFKEAVEKMFAANKNLRHRVILIGGEISMHPELEEMIKILTKYEKQVSQLCLMFNGVLDFKKYTDIFPADRVVTTVSIHPRMLTADELDTVIRNINNSNKNIRSYCIEILVDPQVSEDPVFWKNLKKRVMQETGVPLVIFAPLHDTKFNEEMTEFIYSLDKAADDDDYRITDMDDNVIKASKSDIKSSGRISFEGLYCYSYNTCWAIDIDGDIIRHCNPNDRYSLDEYDTFFERLTLAEPCPRARCGCAYRTRTKKTIDKLDVEAYYRTIFKK